MHFLGHYIFTILWLSWAVFWLASSLSASAPKRVQSPIARVFHLAELSLVAALFTFPTLGYGWLGHRILLRTEALYVVASLLLILGLGFSVYARMHLGNNWSGHVTLKSGHRLIRSGPYVLVRHPIYTGILTAMLGTTMAVDEYRGVVALVIAVTAFVIKLRLEERWLTEEFGSEYDRYRRETKALVPGIM